MKQEKFPFAKDKISQEEANRINQELRDAAGVPDPTPEEEELVAELMGGGKILKRSEGEKKKREDEKAREKARKEFKDIIDGQNLPLGSKKEEKEKP